MKLVAFLFFTSLATSLSAYPAQIQTGVGSGDSSFKKEASQIKPEEIVVKISRRHIDANESLKHGGLALTSNYGTGYCFGHGKCDFILTNYHVAERVGSPLRVNGVKVLQTYEATSPQDKDAVWEKSPQGFSVKLVPIRDIAIFRMEHPLKGMHGIPFSPRGLHEGESVRIHGHPEDGKLTTAEATFYGEARDGLLFFKVKAGEEKVLAPGMSGSLVVNEENEAVGLLQGIFNGNMAAVVPVWSLADFVKKVQPKGYEEMFSSPGEGAIYRPDNSGLVPVDLVAESEVLAKDIGPDAGMSPPPALPKSMFGIT